MTDGVAGAEAPRARNVSDKMGLSERRKKLKEGTCIVRTTTRDQVQKNVEFQTLKEIEYSPYKE